MRPAWGHGPWLSFRVLDSAHGPAIRHVLTYRPMLGKILLTLVVILGAYVVLRTRLRDAGRSVANRPDPAPPPPLIPRETVRLVAYTLVVLMVSGSLLWLYLDWREGHEVVAVRVINANTGAVTSYRARREDVEGRHFTTLDGRRVTLADVERMELK